jgi:hypothetical protein
MHQPCRLYSGHWTDRKRVHCQGTHPRKIYALVRRTKSYFKGFTVEYIEQAKNAEADELVKVAGRNTPLPADVFLQVISDASIKTVE